MMEILTATTHTYPEICNLTMEERRRVAAWWRCVARQTEEDVKRKWMNLREERTTSSNMKVESVDFTEPHRPTENSMLCSTPAALPAVAPAAVPAFTSAAVPAVRDSASVSHLGETSMASVFGPRHSPAAPTRRKRSRADFESQVLDSLSSRHDGDDLYGLSIAAEMRKLRPDKKRLFRFRLEQLLYEMKGMDD